MNRADVLYCKTKLFAVVILLRVIAVANSSLTSCCFSPIRIKKEGNEMNPSLFPVGLASGIGIGMCMGIAVGYLLGSSGKINKSKLQNYLKKKGVRILDNKDQEISVYRFLNSLFGNDDIYE